MQIFSLRAFQDMIKYYTGPILSTTTSLPNTYYPLPAHLKIILKCPNLRRNMYPMLFFLDPCFSIGLYVGLSYCQCTDGSHSCGFLANGSGIMCNFGSDSLLFPGVVNASSDLMDQNCPAAVSGPGHQACADEWDKPPFNVYTAARLQFPATFPPGLTDNAKSSDASCPSRESLLTSLGVYTFSVRRSPSF